MIGSNPLSQIGMVAAGVIIFFSGLLFQRSQGQGPNWTAPYFSAAANFQWDGKMYIDSPEIKSFANLSFDKRLAYKFHRDESARPYPHATEVGFMYFILLAKFLFGWLTGDMQALILLQILVHALISCRILFLLPSFWSRVAFFLIYAINPFILQYVTFNYYYFWQVIPGVLLIEIINSSFKKKIKCVFWGLALGLVVCTRPTVIFLTILGFVLLFRRQPAKQSLVMVSVFLATFLIINKPVTRNFWHTAYIGIGAYSNSYMDSLTDENGYSLMKAKTGIVLDRSPDGNYFEEEIMNKYKKVTRTEYLKILREAPLLLMKNAFCNTLQGFSLGHVSNRVPDVVNYLISFSGLIVIVLLWRQNLRWIAGAVLANCIGFTLYYPPIPAYMFGGYILLSYAAVEIISRILDSTFRL